MTCTFLTNHAIVLICIAQEPGTPLHEVARKVRISRRAAMRIVSDLVEDGYVNRKRVERQDVYEPNEERDLRHQRAGEHEIGELVSLLGAE